MKIGNKYLAPLAWVALFILLSIFIVFLWLYSSKCITDMFPSPADRGTFGDQFGAINSLFSGLAFAGIIITILLQGRELSLQRKELEQTRNVFLLQKFEITYFNLLDLIQHNLSKIKVSVQEREKGVIFQEIAYHGSDANYRLYKRLYLETIPKNRPIDNDLYIEHGRSFLNKHQFLNPFLTSIHNCLKLIFDSNVEDKAFYIDLLKGQLNESDKIIIFLSLLQYENKEFKTKVQASGLINDIQTGSLFHSEIQRKLYDETVVFENEN